MKHPSNQVGRMLFDEEALDLVVDVMFGGQSSKEGEDTPEETDMPCEGMENTKGEEG